MGASAMQLVDEYFRRAKAATAEAKNAPGSECKNELRRLAEQWESLARTRLEILEAKLQRGESGCEDSELRDSK
jgi:hypothetical protein